MNRLKDVLQLRVRYSETDQMGTFYNSRALEWFECGRTELMRNRLRMSYAVLEEKGVFLPLVEAHLEFQGGARYDDLLDVATTVEFSGRAKFGLGSNHAKRQRQPGGSRLHRPRFHGCPRQTDPAAGMVCGVDGEVRVKACHAAGPRKTFNFAAASADRSMPGCHAVQNPIRQHSISPISQSCLKTGSSFCANTRKPCFCRRSRALAASETSITMMARLLAMKPEALSRLML